MTFFEHFFETAFTNPLAYPKPILEALGDMGERRKNIVSLLPSCRIAEKLCREFEKEFPGIEVRVSGDMPWYEGAAIRVPTKDFKELITIRRRVRQLGFDKPRIADHPSLRQRTWVYDKTGMRLTIEGQLPWEENAACRFVKIGTKEEPVYELQCGSLNGEGVAESKEEAEEGGPEKGEATP